MSELSRQVNQSVPNRYFLTCKRESDRTKFKGHKCGPCVEKWGLPVGWKPQKVGKK